MDDTCDQLRPLRRLVPSDNCFSYDLKIATDKWPLVDLFEIVALVFNRSLPSTIVNSTPATNLFIVLFTRWYTIVSFIASQPLGYYSSWPLFSFSHHLLVRLAVE